MAGRGLIWSILRIICVSLIVLTQLLSVASADVRVRGYHRSDGTYVRPHYRSSPDSSRSNNFSYPGNRNPYTGVIGSGGVEAYIRSYEPNGTVVSRKFVPVSRMMALGISEFKSINPMPRNAFEWGNEWFCFEGYKRQEDKCVALQPLHKSSNAKQVGTSHIPPETNASNGFEIIGGMGGS